ncbi:cytochrome-c peroxidase [Persicobacter sp. CCB-QB2]|uniref:cytochrome-c peroxidase n=1 Tax=Persicobacter sp. CCB-QB2 TaxID=1561025 RepID=UPI0006A9BDE4|nr:cytochrome c peroxidase [Persicobacter sp. CCB-QB2]
MRRILILCLSVVSLVACEADEPVDHSAATPISLNVPGKFPKVVIPADNPLTAEGVALGRRVYYDRNLNTKDKGRACGDCHQQKTGFASANEQGQLAIMPHANLAYDQYFLWNGSKEGSLEDVMVFEIRDFFEADLDYANGNEEYRHLAKLAFGHEEISYKTLGYALAQFSRTQLSGNSKFDKFNRGEGTLTEQEKRGYDLFFTEDADCFHCHSTVLFRDGDFHNIGLDATFHAGNAGRFLVTGDSVDIGKFKTPSLRNVAVTAPYMHDNRFATLEEVVDFYSDQVNFTEFTDPLMNHEGGINMTAAQKEDLIAFLKTLTDEEYLENEDFSNPFNSPTTDR